MYCKAMYMYITYIHVIIWLIWALLQLYLHLYLYWLLLFLHSSDSRRSVKLFVRVLYGKICILIWRIGNDIIIQYSTCMYMDPWSFRATIFSMWELKFFVILYIRNALVSLSQSIRQADFSFTFGLSPFW